METPISSEFTIDSRRTLVADIDHNQYTIDTNEEVLSLDAVKDLFHAAVADGFGVTWDLLHAFVLFQTPIESVEFDIQRVAISELPTTRSAFEVDAVEGWIAVSTPMDGPIPGLRLVLEPGRYAVRILPYEEAANGIVDQRIYIAGPLTDLDE